MNVIVYTDDTRDAVEVNENMLCLLVLTSPDYPTAQGDVLHLCQGNGKQQVSFCQFYTTMSYIPTYEVLLDMVAMIDPYHSMEMTSLCEPKMRQLLSLGPDLASTKMQMMPYNKPNEKTALLWAIDMNLTPLVALLLSHGSNPEDIDENGNTAFLLACKKGFIDSVYLLLSFGANIHVINERREDALMLLKRHPHCEHMLKILSFTGLDYNIW